MPRHRAGNTREQPGIVNRQQRQFGHLAVGHLPEIDQQRHVKLAKALAQLGMPHMHCGIESGPVVPWQARRMDGEILIRP